MSYVFYVALVGGEFEVSLGRIPRNKKKNKITRPGGHQRASLLYTRDGTEWFLLKVVFGF
jgi:hypothetical protein